MARPKEDKVDYFFHLTRHGKTIDVLIQRHGAAGYAFWFRLLERLGDTNGHYININDEAEREYLFAYCLADEVFGSETLATLAKMQAIDPELYQKGIIWSQKFVENLENLYKRRGRSLPQKPNPTVVFDSETTAEHEFPNNPESKTPQSRVEKSNPPTPLKKGDEKKLGSDSVHGEKSQTDSGKQSSGRKRKQSWKHIIPKDLQEAFQRFWKTTPQRHGPDSKVKAAEYWLEIVQENGAHMVDQLQQAAAQWRDSEKERKGADRRWIPETFRWLKNEQYEGFLKPGNDDRDQVTSEQDLRKQGYLPDQEARQRADQKGVKMNPSNHKKITYRERAWYKPTINI